MPDLSSMLLLGKNARTFAAWQWQDPHSSSEWPPRDRLWNLANLTKPNSPATKARAGGVFNFPSHHQLKFHFLQIKTLPSFPLERPPISQKQLPLSTTPPTTDFVSPSSPTHHQRVSHLTSSQIPTRWLPSLVPITLSTRRRSTSCTLSFVDGDG